MTREQAIEIIMNPRSGPPPGSREHQEFVAYLENSSECRLLYEQQKALWEALDEWSPVEPSAGFDRRLFDRIEGPGARGTWLARVLTSLRPGFAVGLAGLLIAAASVVYQRPQVTGRDETAGVMSADDVEYLEQMYRALDDIEMLADFDVLPLGSGEQGRS